MLYRTLSNCSDTIRRAYSLLQERFLPKTYQTWYNYQKYDWRRYSEHTAKIRAAAVAEGRAIATERAKAYSDKLESARKMLIDGLTVDNIMIYTNLSREQIEQIRTELNPS